MADFLMLNDLHDLGFVGPKYTWSNNKSENSKIWKLCKELGDRKRVLENRLYELQLIECSNEGLNAEQQEELRQTTVDLNATLARITTWWRQRAKVRWINEGDGNSHFFHSIASGRRRSNRISQVKIVNGDVTDEPAKIQEEFMQFFNSKWKERRVSLANWPEFCNDDLITSQCVEALEADISEQEFQNAVFSLSNNRAPGIDRITSSFLKFYWNIIRQEVINDVASKANAITVNDIFSKYCSWTGQNINSAKSAVLFSKFCPIWKQRRIAKVIGFNRVTEMEYLGVLLALRKLTTSDFSKILKAVMEKTNVWGRRHLSLAGRSTLIRTSLLVVPVYLMTHTMVPKGITFEAGGAGLPFTALWMGPLRARLAWDFVQHPSSMLNKTLIAKYGGNVWEDRVSRGISNTWKVILDGSKALRPIIRWRVGDGKQIDILRDVWIMDRQIICWPTFVDISQLENKNVEDLMNDEGHWDVQALRQCFGECLIHRILAIQINQMAAVYEPELIHSQLSMTITSMAYGARMQGNTYKFIWFKKFTLHPRKFFFWWRLLRVALPTNSWLFRRGLAESCLCPWRCNEEETIEHCVISCNKLTQVVEVFAKWGFLCLFPTQLMNSFGNCISCLELILVWVDYTVIPSLTPHFWPYGNTQGSAPWGLAEI
ncbi:hypothetical protein M5K25_006541 [Dendrobium thyrsiflorum]|uniref:Reverse transcriptase zinc-binding domain-containing protein n=1 Tax=Dendrobium thyrsiflorum TaxID=117978 RepID=A0ABD0VCY4_DENTH